MPQEKMRTLIAQWELRQDCSVDLPAAVYWSDGSPAATEDYIAHLTDTHTFIINADGAELHMFPDLAAHIHYDVVAEQWMIRGSAIASVALYFTQSQRFQ